MTKDDITVNRVSKHRSLLRLNPKFCTYDKEYQVNVGNYPGITDEQIEINMQREVEWCKESMLQDYIRTFKISIEEDDTL